MQTIPEIASQIVNKALSENTEDYARTVFLAGSKSVGKTTMLYSFLEKTEIPRETLVLEYSFGRKSVNRQSIDKTICHVWEYGGKLDVLKNTLSSVPIHGKYYCCVMVDLSKVKNIWSILETFIGAIKETYDGTGIEPELIIIGGKYDIFKNYDNEIKKVTCTTMRSVALACNAHLLFYSAKEPQLVKKAKEMLYNIGFGNGFQTKEKNTNLAKPLVIPKGSDIWESIGVAASTLDTGKTTMLYSFLEKTEIPRETLVLEYSFGRKSVNRQSIDKTICHVWEYGGKLDVLKNTLSSVPIHGKYYCCVMVDLSKVKNIWSILETFIGAIKETYDGTGIEPELIIIGGKYDIFKNYDNEIKKVTCTTMRSVALACNAHLLFYSAKEPQLVKKAKEMLYNIGFGNGFQTKEKNTNLAKPLVIPKGSDIWESIGVAASTLDTGKTTMLYSFLEKTEIPRETLVLEYSFGRKSVNRQSIDKTICHVWEYGGKLDVLKNTLSSVPIHGKYYCCVMVDLSKVKNIWSILETFIGAIKETYDGTGIEPELIIIGGKYDIFKNYDNEIKKVTCTTMRSVALACNAHLLFYSAKEPQLVKKAKEMLYNIGFGNGFQTKEKNTNLAKPLVIPKGSDIWESIGVAASTLDTGKTTMLYSFLEKTEIPRETLVLEYSFGRKSVNRQSIDKTICHVWEYGGKLDVLKNTLSSVPIHGKYYCCVMVDLSKVKNIWSILETFIGAIKETYDGTGIEPELIIIGGKYDIFKNYDNEIKKVTCTTMRSVALACNAHLLFYSAKEPQLVKKAKEMLYNIGFGNGFQTKEKNTNLAKPLVIPKGSDIWESIGVAASTLDTIKARHLSKIAPASEAVEDAATIRPQLTHPEPVLDALAAAKYEELRNMDSFDFSISEYLQALH